MSRLPRRSAHLVVSKLDQIIPDRNLEMTIELTSGNNIKNRFDNTHRCRRIRILGRRELQGR